ncbi:MAG TPA: hypothetical protein VHJ34_11095 [Actinomycetota bacterium]|nr:hypothetical protein [Actinomycetota bacterium]
MSDIWRRYVAWRCRRLEEAKASEHFPFRSRRAEHIYQWTTWRGPLLLLGIAVVVVLLSKL